MMAYVYTVFKNSLLSTTDSLSEWRDAEKKQTKEKTDLIQKMNCPQHLQTHNMLTDDGENTNGTNKGGDLLFANKPQIVPWGTERIPQGTQINRKAILHWSILLQGEQNETKKSSYGLDWRQKDKWYCPVKLDNKQPQKLQDIRRSYKIYWEWHGKLVRPQKKAPKKTDYSEQKHKHQQKENNQKQKWEEKQLYGYFMRQTSEISHEKNLDNVKKGKPSERNWTSSDSSTKQRHRE